MGLNTRVVKFPQFGGLTTFLAESAIITIAASGAQSAGL